MRLSRPTVSRTTTGSGMAEDMVGMARASILQRIVAGRLITRFLRSASFALGVKPCQTVNIYICPVFGNWLVLLLFFTGILLSETYQSILVFLIYSPKFCQVLSWLLNSGLPRLQLSNIPSCLNRLIQAYVYGNIITDIWIYFCSCSTSYRILRIKKLGCMVIVYSVWSCSENKVENWRSTLRWRGFTCRL